MTGAKVLVMVGDGATDLEAKQDGGADMFVGYVKLFPFHSKLGLWEISNVSFPTCFFGFFQIWRNCSTGDCPQASRLGCL